MNTRRMRFLGLMAASLLALVSSAAEVGRITLRPAESDVDTQLLEQLVRSKMRTRVGAEFDVRIMQEDVDRLTDTGAFEEPPKWEAPVLPDGRIEVVLTLTPARTVRAIEFVGNSRIKTKKLQGEVTHAVGVPVSDTQLQADRLALLDKYEKQGFYAASVSAELVQLEGTREVDIVFTIDEGTRAKLKAVRFEGNSVYPTKVLRKSILTRRPWYKKYLFRWGNYFDSDNITADSDMLVELYHRRGYLDFKVATAETLFNADRTWVTVVFRLEEGEPYSVSEVKVSGNERFSSEELLADLRLRAGETYSTVVEEADVRRLERKYYPLGYVDFRCTPTQMPDDLTKTVVLEYRVSEGVPARINDVKIVGNEITKDHVIRRELPIHPTDLADRGLMKETERTLKNMQYFSQVTVTPMTTDPVQADLRDMRIEVEEKSTGQFSVGAGISDAYGVGGTLRLQQSNFDLQEWWNEDPWKVWKLFSARGGGQRLSLDLDVGMSHSGFQIKFVEPWFLDRRLRLDADVHMRTWNREEYDEERMGAGTQLSWPWVGSWRVHAGPTFEYIRLTNFDDEDAEDLEREEEGSYIANRITMGLSRNTLDDLRLPTTGSSVSVEADVVSRAFGSYADYVILTAGGSRYFPVFKRSVLKLRGRAGVAPEIAGDDIAIFDRFFAGGMYTIRGFENRMVGPIDNPDDENPIGGRSMLLGSVELIRPINDAFSVSVFSDWGNVWWDVGDFNPTEINGSVGVGAQLTLPMLPIRVDLGFPIVRDQDHLDSGMEFHFNMGYSY